jgi:RimJ/RimL family protein N-acetyltransferase
MSEEKKDLEPVFLRGKRIIMRPPLRSDLSLLIKWINDPEVRPFLKNARPVSEKMKEEWLERQSSSQQDIILIIVLEGRPIGNIGLYDINWVDRRATTGSIIGEKDCRGKGYGTEAKMLLLEYAFNTLNLRRIGSSVIAFNKRSFNCLKSCGYQEDGVRRKVFYRNGKYWDEILLVCFKRDWQKKWREYRLKHNWR